LGVRKKVNKKPGKTMSCTIFTLLLIYGGIIVPYHGKFYLGGCYSCPAMIGDEISLLHRSNNKTNSKCKKVVKNVNHVVERVTKLEPGTVILYLTRANLLVSKSTTECGAIIRNNSFCGFFIFFCFYFLFFIFFRKIK
jgi:hypothetical protein